MATWKAFLVQPVGKESVATDLVVFVQYYDADDLANATVGPGPPIVPPAKVLHAHVFVFPGGTARAAIQAEIVAEGQRARTTVDQATAINAQFPAGTTLAIP